MSTRPKNRYLLLFFALLLVLCPAADAKEKELSHDTGKKDGHRSNPGAGHIITFEAPKGTWYIKEVTIFGTRYGRGYDPKETLFTLFVCNGENKELFSMDVPYTVFDSGLSAFVWKEIEIDEPVKVPATFKVGAVFYPTASKGIFVGWSQVEESHSSWGMPGSKYSPYAPDKEWMIRAVLTTKKPKASKKKAAKKKAVYMDDFKFIECTVKMRYPALKKKGIDWRKVCRKFETEFKKCKEDENHLLNVYRMLAVLQDMHTGVTKSKVQVHTPTFDGMYGGGLWIAADRGRLVLRAVMEGHDLRKKILPGAELVRSNGRSAQKVHEDIRERMKEYTGWSSDHFLDARLSFQFFHFEKDLLPLEFINPDGKAVKVRLSKWGPGGRGLSRIKVTMPEDVEAKGHAVSAMLTREVGYIRIMGGMNESTCEAFFEAFDELDKAKGILLDCRGMGGGGDGPAWAMAGRFYSERAPLGINGFLNPSGDWQFDGPVVMLQDEREVSSAETLTWSMTETGRAVSVGRPTGGGTIIPQVFDAPSGLFSFRMGCHDRPTPIKKIKPEGIGTPPDVFVPYEPCLLEAHGDPTLATGMDVLLLLMQDEKREVVVDYYAGMLGLDPARLKKTKKKFDKIELPGKKSGFRHVTNGILAPMADWEITLLKSKQNPSPDKKAAKDRLQRLAEIARLMGEDEVADKASSAVK